MADDERPDLIVGGELLLYGYVGSGMFDDGFTARQVREALATVDGDVTVRLNSGGGSAFEGAAIRSALSGHEGRVTLHVEGIAASAASLIAMAGDEIVMASGALMMIHDPAMLTIGNADTHRLGADILDKLGDTYADVYARRSGRERDDVRTLMRAETWMDGEEAVEAGFADRVADDEAEAVAAFDYTIFARAPAFLRDRAIERGWADAPQPRNGAVDAQPAEVRMDASAETQAATDAAEVQSTETQATTPIKTQETATMSAPPDTAEAVRKERERAKDIRKAAMALNLAEMADELIDEGVTADAARAKLIEASAARGDTHEYGPAPKPRASVIRDERETRRTAMASALHAQISGGEPDHEAAAPYMGMSLAEMAAATLDERMPTRTTGDRERVFMAAATHSTSDFPHIFENALNKTLLERYQVAAPTYRQVARRRDFNDFRPHPMVRAGDFPKLQSIGQNGEIKYGTFGENRETAALSSYAVAVSITRQMMVNDELGAIDEVLSDYGSMIAEFEEETFYAFMETATLSDGDTVFHANHDNLGSAGALSVTTLGEARQLMREQTTLGGRRMNLSPAILLTSPQEETEAQQLLAPIQAQQAGNVNPFSGAMSLVVTAQLSGTAWYVFANPAQPGAACFIYGFLRGGEAPRIRTEEPFGRQGMALSIEHDFGLGAIDYRGAVKNAGG